MSRVVRDGYIRIVHDDAVVWYIDNDKEESEFVIARFPFVPSYHLCGWAHDGDIKSDYCEVPLQQFKTLTEALAVLKVIEGSQS